MTQSDCIFCDLGDEDIVIKNQYCYARWDKFPVSPGHLLIIPKRHFETIFDATTEEHSAFWDLIVRCKEILEKDQHPDGYNIGTNVGLAAGQSVFHVHIHVIPRYTGDVELPLGGIRGVLPHMQKYKD